jgi:hypothetical protein
LLTVILVVMQASGSPVAPTQTLLMLGCLSVIASVQTTGATPGSGTC